MAEKTQTRRSVRPREELRDLIIEAASELFARDGFAQPTIRDIAEAAGVPLPTLYRLFIDKRDIYALCCKRAFKNQIAIIDTFYRSTDDKEVILYKLVHAGIAFKVHKTIDFRLLHRLTLDGDAEIISEELEQYHQSYVHGVVIAAATEASGNDSPILRMILLNSFFILVPDIFKFWETSEFDPEDTAAMRQKLLSIIFPKVDWCAVAARADMQVAT